MRAQYNGYRGDWDDRKARRHAMWYALKKEFRRLLARREVEDDVINDRRYREDNPS